MRFEGACDRFAERCLADTRRTDQRHDGTGLAPGVGRQAALLTQLAHGQELDDAFLHLVEAGVVGVEHGTRVDQVEVIVAVLTPWQFGHGVEPGADPPVLHGLRAGALEAIDLALDGRPHVVGQHSLGDLVAVLLGDVLVVGSTFTQLLADGRELLAQEELPLLLLHAVGDVMADLLGQFDLGQGLLDPCHGQLEASLDVDGVEQLDLALDGQIGPPADGVGQGARGLDVAEQAAHTAATDLLEQRPSRGPVLARQLGDPVGGIGRVVDGLGLDPQGRAGADHAGAHGCALDGAHHQSGRCRWEASRDPRSGR